MEKYEYFNIIKSQLKELAKQIRTLKPQRKEPNRNGRCLWDIESDIAKAKYEYRHRHIAYSLMRGRELEQIEKPRQCNQPNKSYIETFMEPYETIICNS